MAASLSPCTPRIRRPLFKATMLWHTIIKYLHRNVQIKKRRHLMKTYEDCFTGADAVSVILRYLLSDNVNFVADISKDKALKLCQLLMESHVFEPVSKEKDDRDVKFEDSNTKFYRFLHVQGHLGALPADQSPRPKQYISNVGDKFRLTPQRINPDLEPDLLSGEGVISNPIAVTRQGQILQEIMNITTQCRRKSTEILKSMSPAKLLRMTRQSSSVNGGRKVVLCSEEETSDDPSAILKQAALTKILRLVDLPFLDDILHYINEPEKLSSCSTVIENTKYGPFSPTCHGSPGCCRLFDEWTEAAFNCLEFHPKGDSILYTLQSKYAQTKGVQFKSELFTNICNHYSSLTEPLMPEIFIDVHIAVLNLFMQSRMQDAVKLLRLSLLLLPCQTRSELEKLLVFIKFVLDDDIKLNTMQSNHTLVEQRLTSCIIRNRLLSGQQVVQLVMLMVDYVAELFKVPDDIQTVVDETSHLTPRKPEYVYCNQISIQEFSQPAVTETMLVTLMNCVLDDTKVTLKDKQQKIKQFQKHHPVLYAKHFSHIM